jgi:hypothetical protein
VREKFLRIAPMLAVAVSPVCAQDHRHDDMRANRDSVSAMATALSTTVSPALAGRARTEARITQPMLAARGSRAGGDIRYSAMLNAERWTMPGGEAVAGIWGEGFIDRRHPHTVVHELMLSGELRRGRFLASVAGGRGFVPFGTDDPMVRPFTKYPANHHLAQVMERVQITAAVRLAERAAVEVSTFNGDEPQTPTSQPQWDRFADSRAARLTVWPRDGVEIQGSVAAVRSPEFLRPDGLDHAKGSASIRVVPRRGILQYGLLEWARTDERYQGRHIITYGSALAEARLRVRHWSLSLRAEQTTRPEDERLLDLFRTARPPNHLVIQGMTHWRIGSAQLARDVRVVRWSHTTLFVEATRAHSRPLLVPVLLDPRDVIGGNAAWHLTAGLRLGVGAMAQRVGRYGAGAGVPATNVGLTMRSEH